MDGIWLLMKFVVRSMVVAGWWAQQSGVVNEKMEREDGIYKKDLPTQSLTLTLTFQDISSEIIEHLPTYDSTTFLSPTLYCRRRGGGNKGTSMYHIDTKRKFLLDHWLSQSPYHPGWQSKCVTNMCMCKKVYTRQFSYRATYLEEETEQALYLPVLSLACLLARIHVPAYQPTSLPAYQVSM